MLLCLHFTHGSSGRCQLGRVQKKPGLTQTGSQGPQPAFCRCGQLPRKGQPLACGAQRGGLRPQLAPNLLCGPRLAALLQASVFPSMSTCAPGRSQRTGRGGRWRLASVEPGPRPPRPNAGKAQGVPAVCPQWPGALPARRLGLVWAARVRLLHPLTSRAAAQLPQVLAAGSRARPPVSPLPPRTRPLAPSWPPFLAGSEGRHLAPG